MKSFLRGSAYTLAFVLCIGLAMDALSQVGVGPGGFLFDSEGNLKVNLAVLISGEDQTNNLIMTSGGAVRITTMTSAVTTNTTSSAVAVPTGIKTFYGQVVGTGSVTQTQEIYGDVDNDAANGKLVCTIILSGTTRDQASCRTDAPYTYYYITTTATSGTSATGAVYAMY